MNSRGGGRDEEYDGKVREVFRQKGVGGKHGKDKSYEVQEERGEDEQEGMEMKGKEDIGGKGYWYLGYILQRSGGQDAQVKNRVKKVAAIIGQV